MRYYYEDIGELPLYNWIKITGGDLTYCRKDVLKGLEGSDLIYYDIIKDDNYKEFGVAKEYLTLLNIELELAESRLDWVITGKNFIKNKIAMLETELSDILNREDKGGDVNETLIRLWKWMGSKVDAKTTTVMEFKIMVGMYIEEVNQQNKK